MVKNNEVLQVLVPVGQLLRSPNTQFNVSGANLKATEATIQALQALVVEINNEDLLVTDGEDQEDRAKVPVNE